MTYNTSKTYLADSPWFWVLLFAIFGSLALAAIGPKYARRQAKLETKYAGRTAAMAGGNNTASPTGGQPGAGASRVMVPVKTLAAVFAMIAVVAGGRLWWCYGRAAAAGAKDNTPATSPVEARQP